MNLRPLGYEQAERRPNPFSLSRDIALDVGGNRGGVSPVSLGTVPSHPVLVTATVTRPGHRPYKTGEVCPADAGAAEPHKA